MAARDISFSLFKLQQSILKDLKRISHDQPTPQYQYDSIYYSDISQKIPSNFIKNHKKAIVLQQHHFCQMLTFAIIDFLFVGINENKKSIIDKLQRTICNQNFMIGSNYIKGMLVKGMRVLNSDKIYYDKPIAQILMQNQAINAFSQFWKQIVDEQYQNETQKINFQQPQPLIFQLVSNYLGIDFNLIWKRQNNYEEQIIYSAMRSIEQVISIMIICSEEDQIMSEIFQMKGERQKTIHYSYIILIQQNQSQQNQNRQNQSITFNNFTNRETNQFDFYQFKERIKKAVIKGNELLQEFKTFCNEINEL